MKPTLGRRLIRLAQATLFACLPALASAQSEAPAARILVGFAAGGSFDATARLLAEKLRSELGRPVLVENRAGAGGRIAVSSLKAAPPDGSVVMLGPDALTSLYPFTMRTLNYDPAQDLVPIGTVSEFPFTLSVGSAPAAESLEAYFDWARQNPERATYGIPARGAPHHFFGMVLSQTIDVDMQDIPYQGSSPLIVGLIGGQVSAGIDVLGSTLEHHRGGKLRILAVSSEQRMPQAPDVPTFAEQGYPQITGMGFNALYAPPGTPQAKVDEWAQALSRVLALPEVREQITIMGALPVGLGPQELSQRITTHAARWEPVIRESGFVAD